MLCEWLLLVIFNLLCSKKQCFSRCHMTRIGSYFVLSLPLPLTGAAGTICMNSATWTVRLRATKSQKNTLSMNLLTSLHSTSSRSRSRLPGPRRGGFRLPQWQQQPQVRESISPSVILMTSLCRPLQSCLERCWCCLTGFSGGITTSGKNLCAMFTTQRGHSTAESFLAYRLVVMTAITRATVTIIIVEPKNIPADQRKYGIIKIFKMITMAFRS